MTADLRTEIIKAEGVTKRFGALVAVDRVDYCLHEYEVAGIIGSNGAGKPTMLRTISGLLKPALGAAFLQGRSLAGLKPHAIARKPHWLGSIFPTIWASARTSSRADSSSVSRSRGHSP